MNKQEISKDVEEDLLNYYYSNPLITYFNKWSHAKAESFIGEGQKLVLDLGCGRGEHLRYIKTEKEYIGLDISLEKLAFGKANSNYNVLINADAENLPFKDSAFDAVISVYNLEHIRNLEKALIEVDLVLKPDGSFNIVLPKESLFYRLGRYLTTKRHAEKNHKIEYSKLIEEEHLYSCTEIIDVLNIYFTPVKRQSHPFPDIFGFANISLAMKMRKKI